MSDHLLVLDEGTTSTRAMLFTPDGRCVAGQAREIHQHYPRPGWVEHDAREIWSSTRDVAAAMVVRAGGATNIAAIGIANQRETVVFWDRSTGEPLAPAIVWQDRRTGDECRVLRERGYEDLVRQRAGLLLDPYFSASKIGWAMREWPGVADAADRLAIGTIESWLMWKLTNGLHITDATNASRTALMSLTSARWDAELLDLFGVPGAALPEIVDCAGRFAETTLFGGGIPICGLAGDQQAASIGQACLVSGETKATFGTGAFILTNAGTTPAFSDHRLLSTVAWQLDGRRSYALEGSIFVAGSLVRWLRDKVGLIDDAASTAALAAGVEDNGGVVLVPALNGLGAPWWEPNARGAITGLTLGATKAHIVRAALEAMAHQAHDLKTTFAADNRDWPVLRIDGGMAANDWIAQDLADILRLRIERPRFTETTALGAAMLAGVGTGLFLDLNDAASMRGEVQTFEPQMDAQERDGRLAGWKAAIGVLLAGTR